MLEDTGITAKVLGALALPVVVVAAAAASVAASSLDRVCDAAALRQVAEATDGVGELVEALRAERDLSMQQRRDETAVEVDTLDQARGRTSELLASVGRRLAEVEGRDLPDDARAALGTARVQLDAVPALRDSVDSPEVGAVTVRSGYERTVRALLALPGAAAQGDTDLDIALRAWVDTQELIDLAAVQGTQIDIAVASGGLSRVESAALYRLSVRRDVLHSELIGSAQRISGAGARDLGVPGTAPGLAAVRRLLLEATAGLRGVTGGGAPNSASRAAAVSARLDPQAVAEAVAEERASLAQAGDRLAAVAVDRSTALEADARRDARTVLSVVALLVLGSAAVAAAVARDVVRRLRRLTRAADAQREQVPQAEQVPRAEQALAAAPVGADTGGPAALGPRHRDHPRRPGGRRLRPPPGPVPAPDAAEPEHEPAAPAASAGADSPTPAGPTAVGVAR